MGRRPLLSAAATSAAQPQRHADREPATALVDPVADGIRVAEDDRVDPQDVGAHPVIVADEVNVAHYVG